MFYYTYVLQSSIDHELYVGWIDNLKDRLRQHNSGKVTATKNRIPFRLIYYEACLDKDNAIFREKALKTGYGRRYIHQRLSL